MTTFSLRRGLVVALCLSLLIVALSALSVSAAVCTTVCYADVTLGNDANDGDTPATAKQTIQAAVNAVNAGGQVIVAAGTYPESVLVNKAVTITGAGPATTIIDPAGEVKITSGDVTIEDLTVQNGNPHGVRIENIPTTLPNITFDNVHFKTNASRGLEISGTKVTNIQVLNSLFDGNVTGIRMSSSAVAEGFIIDNTTFQNHPNTGSGIGFYQANDAADGYVKDLHVTQSTFTGSGFAALYVEEAIDMQVETSNFTGNARGVMIFDWYSSPVAAGTLNRINNNTFEDNTAASVMVLAGNENGLGEPASVDNNTFLQDVGALGANWSVIDVRLANGFTHAVVDVAANQVDFSGTYGAATAAYAIRVRGGVEEVNIYNNELDGGGVGNNGGTPATAGIYVAANDSFYGAMKAATDIDATGNLINNFPIGVVVYDPVGAVFGGLPAGASLKVNRNDLEANTDYGMQSGSPTETDGTCNWWGAADGPGPVGPGSGSNVSSDIAFAPWLASNDLNGLCAAGIFMSTTVPGVTSDALAFGAEDIIKWDGAAWSTWFDGSAAGLVPTGKWKHNLNAIYIPDPGQPDVIVSFTQNARYVPGILPNKVDGMDLVMWDGTDWTLYFDGSDVGLTNKTQEKIDALHVLPGSESPIGAGCVAYLLISTQGPGRVTNGPYPGFRFAGEDVLGFCATNLGADTTGVWHILVDGSAQGMPYNSTDSISMSADGNTLYLTTKKAFNVDAASGGHSMVYAYDMTTEMFSGPVFSAPANGLPKQVDALEIVELP